MLLMKYIWFENFINSTFDHRGWRSFLCLETRKWKRVEYVCYRVSLPVYLHWDINISKEFNWMKLRHQITVMSSQKFSESYDAFIGDFRKVRIHSLLPSPTYQFPFLRTAHSSWMILKLGFYEGQSWICFFRCFKNSRI